MNRESIAQGDHFKKLVKLICYKLLKYIINRKYIEHSIESSAIKKQSYLKKSENCE